MGENPVSEKQIQEIIWAGSPYRNLRAIIEHLEASDVLISWYVLKVLHSFLQMHSYEVFGVPVKGSIIIVRGEEKHKVPVSEGAWGTDWKMPKLGHFWEFPRPYLDSAIPFVKLLLQDMQISRVLDIAAVPQSFAFSINDKFKPETIAAFPHHAMKDECEWFASKLFPDSTVNWCNVDSIGGEFDLVLGTLCSPVEKPSSIGWREQLDMACSRLSSNGIGIFHVHTSFFVSEEMRESPYGPFGEAEKFYLQAALILPGMSVLSLWEDEWFANEYLIIVSQGKQDDLFVGEISTDINRTQMLLDNLKARKNGTPMRYGLVTTVEYVAEDDSETLQYQFAIDELRGLQLIPLSEYIDRLEFVNQETSDSLRERGISYNLSSHGLEVDLPSGFNRESILIVFDTDRVNPTYLVSFLNQHMGHTWWGDEFWMSLCLTETDIIHRILNTGVYMPELKLQESILRAITGVRNLSTDIEIMMKTLWKSPRRVENSLDTFGEKTFESWLATLPYPLASILWIYHATANPRRKVEHLLNFFEALAQFNATLLLSGFSSDVDYFTNNIQDLIKSDDDYRDSFVRSSFGTWNILMKKLAKFVRVQLDLDGTRKTCLHLFSNPPLYTLKMISDKRIGKLLDEACIYRNEWKGHTGVAGDDVIKYRLTVLEDLLSRLRNVISNNFDGLKFVIRLEEFEFKNQIHKYRIQHLTGFSIPLPEDEVKTTSSMQNDQIYFIGEKSLQPIVLLPFVLMHTSEKTGSLACYFYSRWEDDLFHLVSYHYEDDSEITYSDNLLTDAIKLLVPNDESKS